MINKENTSTKSGSDTEKEIAMLVSILDKHKKNYTKEEIIKAITAEGYTENIAEAVFSRLFKSESREKKEEIKCISVRRVDRHSEQNKTTEPAKEIKPKDDSFKPIENMIDELKSMKTETKDIIQDVEKTQSKKTSDVNTLQKELDDLETELHKTNPDLIKLNTGELIDLSKIPRKDWRNYRGKGRFIIETLSEELAEKRREIIIAKRVASKSAEPEPEILDENRTMHAPRHIHTNSKPERKTQEESLNNAAETIYAQIQKHPESGEFGKKKNEEEKNEKTDTNKKEQLTPIISQGLDLDTGLDLNEDAEKDDLTPMDLDLNLDLPDLSKIKNKKNKN